MSRFFLNINEHKRKWLVFVINFQKVGYNGKKLLSMYFNNFMTILMSSLNILENVIVNQDFYRNVLFNLQV